ncbi:CBS-domain-containing membrane protein [Candidatus Magnetoovum chiemensis]|nr:CBS-domain-containing membrane protein [Candidatus Magnetoovum chiemensis]
MEKYNKAKDICASQELQFSDEDVYEAMREISGYLDITPGDAADIYKHAYSHAFKRLTESLKAGDIMTKPVITVKPDTPLSEAAEILAKHSISGVPVIDDASYVLGVISEKDFISAFTSRRGGSLMDIIVECLKGGGCMTVQLKKLLAKDIMSAPAITVGIADTIWKVADLFSQNNINRAPVVDAKGVLIGIVTRGDVVSSSCSILNPRKS